VAQVINKSKWCMFLIWMQQIISQHRKDQLFIIFRFYRKLLTSHDYKRLLWIENPFNKLWPVDWVSTSCKPFTSISIWHGDQRCHSLGFLPRSWVFLIQSCVLGFFLRALGFSRFFSKTLSFSWVFSYFFIFKWFLAESKESVADLGPKKVEN